jgi:hypothetical protein
MGIRGSIQWPAVTRIVVSVALNGAHHHISILKNDGEIVSVDGGAAFVRFSKL